MKIYSFLVICFTSLKSVKFIEDLNIRSEEFEQYPLVYREEEDSYCEGVKQVKEIRDVGGEEVVKFTLLDISSLHFIALDEKTKATVEVWHRSDTLTCNQHWLNHWLVRV